ncbi:MULTISPECIES: class I SAM-dependent methyltransferase [unclassified Luteimonas]
MAADLDTIHADLASFHSEKLAEHGVNPRGAGWNGEPAQATRFEQLAKIIRHDTGFSLNDLGCGYGALLDYLRPRHGAFDYAGYDVSDAMIEAAGARHASDDRARFVLSSELQPADYSIASGIFSLRVGRSDEEWLAYVESVLDGLDRNSRHGFAFNSLTIYSDADKMRDELFYADPCVLFDLCKRRYSRNVALLHDYELYDFTILVRKSP